MNSGRQRRTPFSIADILGPSMIPRAPSAPQLPEASPDPASPLCALEELTSKTFLGRDPRALQPSEGTTPARSLVDLNLVLSPSLSVSFSVCLSNPGWSFLPSSALCPGVRSCI
ncbi:transcription factor LBX2 [Sigmodon hispidus]